eukprot:s2261_g11.t1
MREWEVENQSTLTDRGEKARQRLILANVEGPSVSRKGCSTAIVSASHVLGTAASVASSQYQGGSFALEWALDSGAGKDLSSVGAFANQRVPQDWVEGFSTVSSSPLTFEGGGAKAATNTVGYVVDKAGDGMVYMLKTCPYVRSLGKMIQKGFSFFWGPEHEPTLVPRDVPFNVLCETSKSFTADKVEHCVPIFKETFSFTYGMPAENVEAASVDPCLRVDGTETEDQRLRGSDPIMVEDVVKEAPYLEDMFRELQEDAAMSNVAQGAQEASSVDPKDLPVPVPPPDEHEVEPKVLTSYAKLPVDHLLTHQPASKFCDVCRQAKLRARAHKLFGNQSESTREARIIESPIEFLQRICVDHLESTEESLSGNTYAFICVDKFSGVTGAYPAKSKSQAAVEQGSRHFCREKLPVVESNRYPSILAAVRDLKMHSDPSPPNEPIHNSHVESAINIVRQGTRSLLLQSGLHVCIGHRQCVALDTRIWLPGSTLMLGTLFDTIDYEEDAPVCPPRTPEGELPHENLEPEGDPGEHTPGSMASTPESFWEDVQGTVEGDLAELVAVGVGKAVKKVGKMGLLI